MYTYVVVYRITIQLYTYANHVGKTLPPARGGERQNSAADIVLNNYYYYYAIHAILPYYYYHYYYYIVIIILHPVSVRRFLSFRTQPLENREPLPMKKHI